MPSSLLEYTDGATTLEAYVARPATEASQRPAVLVCHAWGGRGEFENHKADQLASLGYVGIAIDVYGKGVRGNSTEENAALMAPFVEDRMLLRRRLLAGLDAARGIQGVDAASMAAIGFCFGGLCVLDLARAGADLKGVVSFHGLFTPLPEPGNEKITASVLALHGHEDPMVPPEAVLTLEEELSAAGVDWQIHAYGHTMHAFSNPDANAPDMGMQYNETMSNRAWTSMQHFLRELL